LPRCRGKVPRRDSRAVFVVARGFKVVAGREAQFERLYDSGGEWQELLKKSEGFLRTELRYESVAEARYSSFDHWRSHTDFEMFREAFQAAVTSFEEEIAGRKLIESEVLLGSYYVDESGDDEDSGLVQA
jgi:hypothetical protein